MIHDATFLTTVFAFFLNFSLGLLGVWGFFWILGKLLAPLLRLILGGIRT